MGESLDKKLNKIIETKDFIPKGDRTLWYLDYEVEKSLDDALESARKTPDEYQISCYADMVIRAERHKYKNLVDKHLKIYNNEVLDQEKGNDE